MDVILDILSMTPVWLGLILLALPVVAFLAVWTIKSRGNFLVFPHLLRAEAKKMWESFVNDGARAAPRLIEAAALAPGQKTTPCELKKNMSKPEDGGGTNVYFIRG